MAYCTTDTMIELSEAISRIDAICDWRIANYKERSHDPELLHRQLIIFDLIDVIQRYQNEKQRLWNALFAAQVSKGETAAAAERLCDVTIPEANELRRRIRSVTKVGEAIRSELSYLKSEHQNLER